MQALYAVSFDIRSAQEQPGRVYESLRGHLADWLGHHGGVPAPSVTELDRDGRAVLVGKFPGHGDRTVSWAVAGDELTRALRMTTHQPLSTGPAQFVTRVTVSQSEAMAGSGSSWAGRSPTAG